MLSGFWHLFEKRRGRIFKLTVFTLSIFALALSEPQAQLFGDGSDGDATIAGTVTLATDMDYNNLTVTAAGILITDGYQVRVNGTLTNFGTISSGFAGNAGGGGPGGSGGFGIHITPTGGLPGVPGSAGPAGSGVGGGGGGGGGAWDAVNGAFANGGMGGPGGAGGSGALPLFIYARTLDNSGTISANGQPGMGGLPGTPGTYDSYIEIFFNRDHAGGGGAGGGGGQGGGGGDVTVVY